MLKDIPKHLIRRNFPYNIAQVEDAFAQVLRDKVAGQADGESFLHAMDGVKGAGKGFVVAHVGNDDVAGW